MGRRDLEGLEGAIHLLSIVKETSQETLIRNCYECGGYNLLNCPNDMYHRLGESWQCMWKVAVIHDVEKYRVEKATGVPACLTFDYLRVLDDEHKK